jgi:hemerythrin-like domain-containing protein
MLGSGTKKRIDPIAQFMQEHDEILTHLSSLNKATSSIVRHGFSDDAFNRILAAMRFIQDEVSVHNMREEEALFPVIERYVEGPTGIMREDHKYLKKEFINLQRSVKKLGKKKEDPKLALELQGTAKNIVQRLVNHIHKENHILFPLVQKFLTKDALREVARRMLHS